ncbi:MAG: transposase [Halomonas sp.]|nr:transposase [Halomonas sp.]
MVFKEVNDAYTTQTCSSCGSLTESKPKGIAELGIRIWTCSECRISHNRDINAAKNVMVVGHGRFVVGSLL